MTTTLVVCVGCARHVRASDPRCPFCGAAVTLGDAPTRELPRGASRAVVAALGATLSLGACQSGATTSAPPRATPAHVEAHPTIAAPYGVPPLPRPDHPLPAPVSALEWFVTLRGSIPMAERATTRLELRAVNHSAAAVAPQREHLHLRVNGVRSPAFDLAFNNGTMPPHWDSLPPGETARDERALLEALMPAPGEYALVLEWDDHVVARRTVTVTP